MAPVIALPGVAQELLPVAAEHAHPQIAALAERLAAQLQAANKKKPFVLDLSLPGDQSSPLGTWLADKVSESLEQSHPELQVVPRSRWESSVSSVEIVHDQNELNAVNEQRARSLGAEVVIRGNFAAVSKGIGVTLSGKDRLGADDLHLEALAELSLTPEMQALLLSPLPRRIATDGFYQSGNAGIGSVVCEQCPPPQYTYVARVKKLAGIVILNVAVTTLGNPERINIIRTPHKSLSDAAIKTVRDWKFKPAVDTEGNRVPVTVEINVLFKPGRQ